MKNMKKNLGDFIRTSRIEANLSQSKLAELCGISEFQLIDIENGLVKKPRFKTLKSISEHLNLELKKLAEICGYNLDDTTLGGFIKMKRLEAKLSSAELANLCVISLCQLYSIEKNTIKRPRLSTLNILSKNLNTSLDKLKELAGYDTSDLPNEDEENLANIIKKARSQMKLSLNEVANFCQISVSCLDNIESGKINKPHLSTLKSLAKQLNLDLGKLMQLAGYTVNQEDMPETLGSWIKSARLETGISRYELSYLYQISEANLLKIENGKIKKPSLLTLQKLAKTLKLDLDKLKALAGYNNNQENLASFIKEARLNCGFSLDEAAKLCQLSINTIYSIEAGKTKTPNISTLPKIANQLNLDLGKLLELAGYKNNLNNEQENLANFIKNARLEAGFSIKQLAQLCQISNDNLSSIENDLVKKPRISTLKSLADVLNLDLAKLKELAGFNNVQEFEQENLGNYIQNARLKAKYSANQLANLCKIPHGVLYNIESGKVKKPQIQTLKVLAKQLNLDLDKLTQLAGYIGKQENEQKNLGNFIKKARLKSGLPLDEAAKFCQLSSKNLYNIENGVIKKPNVSTLRLLSEHLDLDFNKMLELCGYSNNLRNEQENLGDFIKNARFKARFSIAQSACICKISTYNLRNIESGKIKKPNIKTLKALAEALNLDLSKLKELAGYNVDNEQENLGNIIQNARLEANLSIEMLSQTCQLSTSSLYRIEAGEGIRPHLSSLQLLAKTLNLDLTKLKQLAGYNNNVVSKQENLGTFIKNARLKANLSIEMLSQTCNLSKNTLYRIEANKGNKPHLLSLQLLAKTLDLDLDKLKQLAEYKNVT